MKMDVKLINPFEIHLEKIISFGQKFGTLGYLIPNVLKIRE
jgi:hypothetical protein